jgi:hypothetical protein
LKELPLVLAGGAGIGLGKNPNGFIANDMRPKWDVFLQEPAGLVGVIVILAAVWGLRVAHAMNNWTYAIITLGILAVAPGVMGAIHGKRVSTAAASGAVSDGGLAGLPGLAVAGNGHTNGQGSGYANGGANSGGRRLSGPLEWLGINQPFQPGDVAVINEALALPPVREGTSRGAS